MFQGRSIQLYLNQLVKNWQRELEKVSFNDFTLPLVGNTEAQIMKSEDVKALLARQVMEPVRFMIRLPLSKNLV